MSNIDEYYRSLFVEYLFRLKICSLIDDLHEPNDDFKYLNKEDILHITQTTPIPLLIEYDISFTYHHFLRKMPTYERFIKMNFDEYKKHFYILKINKKYHKNIDESLNLSEFIKPFHLHNKGI